MEKEHKFSRLTEKYRRFSTLDWITFTIGISLIICYIVITFYEWYMVSLRNVEAYEKIKDTISAITNGNQNIHLANLLYPNANRVFWGGSTYWFTFLSNVFMGVTLTFYPFVQKSLRAQKFYFASMVFIIVVAGAYWTGIAMVPSTFLNTYLDEKFKSIFMHAVAPILGLSTLLYERKRINVATASIWSFAFWPIAYLFLLIIPTYVFGYKFMQFGIINRDGQDFPPNELDRGIVIYQLVSFNYPLGYKGDIFWVKILMNILMIFMAFITAPVVGFILRKILRIPNPGQVVQKIYFVSPTIKQEKEEFIRSKTKKSILHAYREEEDSQALFYKTLEEIKKLQNAQKENKENDSN
ncbi:MAGa3780 family membrane protein [Mycoplasma buteonis]|uniref:MAGa3780 family membrane protein n=1 Tax=Mycoplasma buteonis TaxID=171280 RepID=UPI00056010DD|nr:hypothetical protein [Mycoplasma buteonis]